MADPPRAHRGADETAVDPMTDLRLTDGHYSKNRHWVTFVHFCPGFDCAVKRFIGQRKASRLWVTKGEPINRLCQTETDRQANVR